jgi:hypothetical protein
LGEEPKSETKSGNTSPIRPRFRPLEFVDAFAKLLAASALILGAYIANSYQSKLVGTTILSQREQSETQLRASMFSSLIEPIIGPAKGDSLPADRERLLVELLVLNFHEHFELKPLLLHADERLGAKNVEGMTPQQAQDARQMLHSIVRRVTAQQIASLIHDKDAAQAQSESCSVYLVSLATEPSANPSGGACQISDTFENVVRVESPDKKYTLNMVASNPNWDDETFNLSVNLTTNSSSEAQRYQDLAYNFTLTWFDLPLTDNTLLPDGNRFSFSIAAVMKGKGATLRLIWFPKDYVTPRERPLDSRQYLELVGKR